MREMNSSSSFYYLIKHSQVALEQQYLVGNILISQIFFLYYGNNFIFYTKLQQTALKIPNYSAKLHNNIITTC